MGQRNGRNMSESIHKNSYIGTYVIYRDNISQAQKLECYMAYHSWVPID